MGKDDVFRDGKAEAGASGFAGTGLVDAVETFEETGQVFRGNAGAEILHVEFDATLVGAGTQDDAAAGASVLHGIVDQVGEDLVDRLTVSQDNGQCFGGCVSVLRILDVQVHTLTAGNLSKVFFRIVEQFDGRDWFGIEAGFAGFNTRQGQ